MSPTDACLADLVDLAADPDAEAVVFPAERATYGRLAELSRRSPTGCTGWACGPATTSD